MQYFKNLGGTVKEQSTQEEEIKNRIAKYSQNVECMYILDTEGQECAEESQVHHSPNHIKAYYYIWKWMLDFDKKARTAYYNSRHESDQNGTRGYQMGHEEKWRPTQTG